jgi:hypothetical protein
VKDRITDAVLVAPDRPKEGGNIPHLGFWLRGKKCYTSGYPQKKVPPIAKMKNKKRRETKKSAKKSAKKNN